MAKAKILIPICFAMAIAGCKSKDKSGEGDSNTDGTSPTTSGYVPAGTVDSNKNSPLGNNLYNWSYFRSGEWTFIDAMLKSSRWFPMEDGTWDSGSYSKDDHGWPTGGSGTATSLAKLFFAQIDGHYPEGEYVLLWEGDDPGWDIGEDASDLSCDGDQAMGSCTSGRATFQVQPSDEGFSLSLPVSGINSSDYPRNVRIIMPGGVCGDSLSELKPKQYCSTERGGSGTCDSGQTCYDFEDVYWNRFSDELSSLHQAEKILFHPLTMHRFSPYAAIRGMEPMGINFGNDVVDWDDRGKLSDDHQGHEDRGGAPELLFAMANVLGADLWLNIPHQVNDEYVNALADLAFSELNSSRNLYIEYTNEHWNPASEYPQSDYVVAQAKAENIGSGEDDGTRGSLYYATRAVEIFKIFRSVFGDEDDRVIRVLGTWVARPDLTEAMLAHSDVADNVDLVAVGHYMGLYLIFDYFSDLESMSLDDFFNEVLSGGLDSGDAKDGAVGELESYLLSQVEVASDYGVDIVAYEGGQHLWYNTTEDNEAISSLFEAANRDVRMETLYTAMFDSWRENGGKLFMHFYNIGPYHPLTGNFGAMEHQDSDPNDYPKTRAILKFIENNPRWW